ncbi:lipoprotein [Lysinibacillus alkalisoli]|uniref:Lipoprotein n=1 Tax=Lysinibacillus alkalisoli TaxID=1911548 RepID=A0A917G8Q1_9BACI|nr:DUF5052 family protein [Lysinibacillus alkalisoli]GGG27986.1 lipoprotein [Lysinibacillus alkalisoli]
MKKWRLVLLLIAATLLLSSCNAVKWFMGNVKEELVGRELILQTYDEDSQMIDSVKGKSISIEADEKFAIKDKEGSIVSKSAVLNITVGGNQMLHVGSSMLAYDTDLVDIFNEYSKTVDIDKVNRSVPFINRMVNDMKNFTTGTKKVVLIRSQSGKPLATFAGDDVSYYASDIDKATGLMIDGKYLLIYRCDYTIYDTKLLLND